jgi:predicted DNA-binding WGR domain protein
MLDIPVEKQIAKDSSMPGGQSLTETFDQKSYESQAYQIEDQQAKKEYVKTFIENAKKNGYHITLSDDLQVTSVQPIRKPTNQANDNDTFESDPSN